MPEHSAGANSLSDSPPKGIVFYPFSYALYTDELTSFCWYCLKTDLDIRLRRCGGCHFAIYCNHDCQKLGWKDHKGECKGFKKVENLPDIEVRLLGRIVVRYKDIYKGRDKTEEGFYQDRQSRRSIMDIWSHADKMIKDPVAIKKFEELYAGLVEFYEEKNLMSKETVFQLHCRDYINRHAICDKGYVREIGKGLYLDLCQYDHSCRPNVIYTCDGFVATLRALSPGVNLADIKNTHYTYIDLLNPVQQRRKLLRDTWYFDCMCERCIDQSDHRLSAVLCPNCQQGEQEPLCIFGEHPYKDPESQKITCPKCSNEVQKEYVVLCIESMRQVDNIFEDADLKKLGRKEQIDFLDELFTRYTQILPPTNVFLGRLIQGLISRSSSNEDLLRLHLASEPCVRICFPHNHPAVAFHFRNIGIFLSNLGKHEEALPYFEDAQQMLEFVLGTSHSLFEEVSELRSQSETKLSDQRKRERFANLTMDQRRRLIEEDVRRIRIAEAEPEKANSNGDGGKESGQAANVVTPEDDDLPPLV